jgi:hypothetical protein
MKKLVFVILMLIPILGNTVFFSSSDLHRWLESDQ